MSNSEDRMGQLKQRILALAAHHLAWELDDEEPSVRRHSMDISYIVGEIRKGNPAETWGAPEIRVAIQELIETGRLRRDVLAEKYPDGAMGGVILTDLGLVDARAVDPKIGRQARAQVAGAMTIHLAADPDPVPSFHGAKVESQSLEFDKGMNNGSNRLGLLLLLRLFRADQSPVSSQLLARGLEAGVVVGIRGTRGNARLESVKPSSVVENLTWMQSYIPGLKRMRDGRRKVWVLSQPLDIGFAVGDQRSVDADRVWEPLGRVVNREQLEVDIEARGDASPMPRRTRIHLDDLPDLSEE